MERLKYYFNKYKMIMILCSVILVLTLIIAYLIIKYYDINKSSIDKDFSYKLENNNEQVKKTTNKKILVDIKGAVISPGVYELDENSRVIDVINMSGGMLDKANTKYLNLSKKIKDGMVIIIYTNDEIKKYENPKQEQVEFKCSCPDKINDSCISKKDVANETISSDNNNNSEDTIISINTSTKDELMTLNGIGESKAEAIIEYREKNQLFKSIDEIKNVSGIGESAYSKIKDNIKL